MINSMRPPRRLVPLTALAVAVLAATPVAATASIGAGVSADAIVASHPVVPGSVAELPAWWVQNTGTQTTTYTLSIAAHVEPGQQPLQPAWVDKLAPVTLRPGAHAVVPIRVTVPSTATAGDYAAYLMASASNSTKSATGAAVGAAAATDLELRVASPPDHVGITAPAIGITATLLIVGLALRCWRRRPAAR